MATVTDLRNRVWGSLPAELRWLVGQLHPHLAGHLLSVFAIGTANLLALATPLTLKWLVDTIIPGKNIGLLVFAIVLIFISHQGISTLTSLGNYLTLTAAQRMGVALRVNLVRHLDTLSADYYENTSLGTILFPLKEPIEEICYFASEALAAILRMLLATGTTLVAMFAFSPLLTVVVAPLIVAFLLTRQYFHARLVADAEAAQNDRRLWHAFLEEHFTSAVSIQLLAQERRQERRAFVFLARAARSQQRVFQTACWFNICVSLAVAAATSTVIGYGGLKVLAGGLSLGSLVAFYGFVMQLFDPLTGASEIYARAQKTMASIRQVQSAFALRPSVENLAEGVRLSPEEPLAIGFNAVEFRYRRQKRLLDIPSLGISPGERVALVGENGAGKSTLLKLIARLYDPTVGSIRIGREDLSRIDLKSLRRSVCYVQCNSAFFEGTIASNLRFVRPAATPDEIDEVLEAVGLTAMIRSSRQGVDERIGPGGCQLSAGEQQRLAIARVLLQRPRILMLDEATSCLDPSSEAMIFDHLGRRLNAALIVVSHRSSTIQSFQRIVTLAHGKIASDTHSDSSLIREASKPRAVIQQTSIRKDSTGRQPISTA